ncbi:YdcF family protein [Synechococcus sp. HK05]|uniref:YdcF family protein n=1 Tax=Synechococcus sp. HK05 TaxID=2725975 RepID=UPI001C38597C|nr:YdcF family protein [Synechococcus sp. HK05]MBV2350358.1 YdcF family protein [Synechococcus sp. HK05]
MPLAIAWSYCPPDPLLWLELREPLLQLLYQPWLVLPLLGGLSWCLSGPLPTQARIAAVVALMVLAALLYSPMGTAWLSAWLDRQLPPFSDPAPRDSVPAVVVLVGRGPQVAAATTAVAASIASQGSVAAVYVSGDAISTAQALERQGVPAQQISGDSCARTTWENATRTAAWLHRHHPRSPVLLLTDPWQLPRATAAFRRQGLHVQPLAVEPSLSPGQRNRLALRETAGTLLYALQRRL